MIDQCLELSTNPVAGKEAHDLFFMLNDENKKILDVCKDSSLTEKQLAKMTSVVLNSAMTKTKFIFNNRLDAGQVSMLKDMLKIPNYKMITVSTSPEYPNDAIVCFGSVKFTKDAGMVGAIKEVVAISFPPKIIKTYPKPTKMKFNELEPATNPIAKEAVKLILTLSDPEFRTDSKEELANIIQKLNPPKEVVRYITLADLEYMGDCFSDIDNETYIPLMATDPYEESNDGIIYIIPMPEAGIKFGKIGTMWQNVKCAKDVSFPLRQKAG